jgi:predicted small integral membrane protein
MLKTAKTLLIACVALWGFVGAFLNLVDWGGTLGSVGAATSMATFEGGTESWRATDSLLLIWLGALFIMLSKLTAAVLCSIGAMRMWQTRHGEAAAFMAAKVPALTGCAVAMIMLFAGFIVVAESWFELWRSDVMRGPVLESAFRYGGMIMLIAIFVAGRDD